MNRRKFITAGSFGFALIGTQVAAFQRVNTSTVLVSELTDAEVDYAASGFEFVSQASHEITGETGAGVWETFTFRSGLGELTIEFTTIGVVNMPRYMEERSLGHQAMSGAVEHSVDQFETGGFLILSFDSRVSYLEYQLGALPTADMIVTLTTEQTSLQAELAQTQTIMVGGAPPYLFLAESGVESIEIGVVADVTAVPNRSSRATTAETTPQPTTAATNSTTSAGSESDYAAAITVHRTQFRTSYGEFSDYLATVGEDTTTDAEAAELFTQMNEIALVWQDYPTNAQALAIPPGMESLGAIYGEWADVIGEMGTLFEELYMGVDTIDAFIAAITRWETLDAELEAELSVQGFAGLSAEGWELDSIKIGLRATRW